MGILNTYINTFLTMPYNPNARRKPRYSRPGEKRATTPAKKSPTFQSPNARRTTPTPRNVGGCAPCRKAAQMRAAARARAAGN